MFIVPPELEARYGEMIAKQTAHILPHWVLEHVHVEILTLEPGEATFRLHGEEKLFRRFPPPHDVRHLSGQAVMALADTLLIFPVLASVGHAREMATLNMSTEFLRPIHDGDITIRAYVLKTGRTAIRGRVDIYDAAGKLSASSTVCYVYVNPQAPTSTPTGDAS
ncbi:MAG: PaaI family thioesterase [Cardiobacteriaceae bacterium]|nr:PaaI family thioesterase [Cardiobacteriaceae bacterium]